nr:synaptic vesicle glycoprotein 2A isoform X1 [Helicoverpa armigera]XP_049700802.1 synaptic vesicle glycoprotein 2A isoform X2 [Helicoverpa armigera]
MVQFRRMSDLDLPALAERERAKAREEWRTPMKEIDAALIACTFGRFHIKLLTTAFVGFLAGILASSTTAYLLPSAECDLQMDLLRKGLLNAMPYVGMLISSVVAGFLTDAFGRKIFLGVGFLGLFIFQLIGGSSQTFELLATAKFFEGLLYATAFSACVSLTAEFSYSSIRDRMILFQSSFIAVSHVVIAGMSWAILTNEWRYSMFGGKFVLNTWNFYLYITSLWAFAAFIMYVFCLPESPKYLITQKKYDEAREILIKIYVENTGKPAETYPFYNIWKDKNKHSIDETPEDQIEMNIRHQIVVGLHNVKPMFQKPLGLYLAMTCFSNFIIMAMYNVLRLWFPQVSAIVEHNPMTAGQDLCTVLDKYTASLEPVIHNATVLEEVCVPTKSGHETYINSIIIGCVCIIPYLITGILVNRVGKKTLLIVAGLISIASSLGLRWANTKTAVVSLFSLCVAIAQSMLSLNQAMTVEHFPTTTRTLAISLIMVIGRIGTLSGNIAFPVMLQMGCQVPFFTISGSMCLVTFVAFFLPSKKQ